MKQMKAGYLSFTYISSWLISTTRVLLFQLPVPEHMNERLICNAIHPSKDVDGFHVINVGR